MTAIPTSEAGMRTFILGMASPVIEEKFGDAVQSLEREKGQQSKRIDSIDSKLTTNMFYSQPRV